MARPGGHRKFYDFSGQAEQDREVLGVAEKNTKPEELVKYVAKNILGGDAVFSSPFGARKGKHTLHGNTICTFLGLSFFSFDFISFQNIQKLTDSNVCNQLPLDKTHLTYEEK